MKGLNMMHPADSLTRISRDFIKYKDGDADFTEIYLGVI